MKNQKGNKSKKMEKCDSISSLHWSQVLCCLWYITMGIISASALPIGIVSLHVCPIHILPIWLIFHGIISVSYYGNALYSFSLMPLEVRSLKDRYMSLRETIDTLSSELDGERQREARGSIGHDRVLEMTVRDMEHDSPHKPFRAMPHEWMSLIFFLAFVFSMICGIIILSMHTFCQRWTYAYAVSLCIVTCVIFFFQTCKHIYM